MSRKCYNFPCTQLIKFTIQLQEAVDTNSVKLKRKFDESSCVAVWPAVVDWSITFKLGCDLVVSSAIQSFMEIRYSTQGLTFFHLTIRQIYAGRLHCINILNNFTRTLWSFVRVTLLFDWNWGLPSNVQCAWYWNTSVACWAVTDCGQSDSITLWREVKRTW